jgi:hypothetical protein
MKAHTLLAVVAIASLVSCTGLPPGTQAKLDQASIKYESATGITPAQTALLAGKWWIDYERAKTANEILRTQASPITSTKEVINVQPQASAAPPSSIHHPPSATLPPPQPPRRIRRHDAHHRLQIAYR